GKSSLLNTLLQKERAIVSRSPGTTRDTIEEMVLIKGFPLWIIDTAGLREVESYVEKEAVTRTRDKIEQANIILLMVDGSRPLAQEDESIFERVEKKKTLVVINKIDLPQKVDRERMRCFFPGVRMVEISATQEINLAELKQEIARFALKEATLPISNPLIINLRQQSALELTKQHVNKALGSLREESSEELIAFEVKEGISRLGEITGEVVAEEILDQIFSHFCIGK
ncbi:MAG: GTP-binding protein, partial [Candidatus Hydrothermarchaeota archaeon]